VTPPTTTVDAGTGYVVPPSTVVKPVTESPGTVGKVCGVEMMTTEVPEMEVVAPERRVAG
jgi:hypothetical protein